MSEKRQNEVGRCAGGAQRGAGAVRRSGGGVHVEDLGLGLGEEQGGGGVKILSSAVVSQQKLIDSNQERLSIGQQSVGEILNQDFLKKEKGFLLCQVLAVQQLSVILGVILMVAAGFVFMIGEEIFQIYCTPASCR